ncbi:MAG: hypothetical protein OXU36_01055 [Candidatus Poribacteria bacterium]|nr:hypothetical protein [Candidatus Poribacteria bacterium]
MSNHFNDLLLETLKEIRVRLDRLEGRADRLIEQKADKSDVEALRADLTELREEGHARGQLLIEQKADKSDVEALRADGKALRADLTELREEGHARGQRLDRIEAGIKTLQWTMTASVAVIGLALAFFKAC